MTTRLDEVPVGALLDSAEMCERANITYRQLDYWTQRGLLRVEGDPQPGSGRNRWWPLSEVEIARRMGVLADAGITPKLAERAARGGQPIPGVRIVFDGDGDPLDDAPPCTGCASPLCPDCTPSRHVAAVLGRDHVEIVPEEIDSNAATGMTYARGPVVPSTRPPMPADEMRAVVRWFRTVMDLP